MEKTPIFLGTLERRQGKNIGDTVIYPIAFLSIYNQKIFFFKKKGISFSYP